MDLQHTIGRRIASVRTLKGLSQSELADLIGVHMMVISKWERGLVSPNARSLIALCDALGCTADFILGMSNEIPHA